MPRRVEIRIALQPKQDELYDLCEGSVKTRIGFGGSRGGAKALHVDTLIPVPLEFSLSGFKRISEIVPGDAVFSSDGSITRVADVTPIVFESAYSVQFNTGEIVIANGSHLWLTKTKAERIASRHRTPEFREARKQNRPSRAKVDSTRPWLKSVVTQINSARLYNYLEPPPGLPRTTKDIAETLTVENGREINHSIDVCFSLQTATARLPIEPYLLGLWLGDGHSRSGIIGMSEADFLEILLVLPVPARKTVECPPKRKNRFMECRWEGLSKSLRMAGLIYNKHIPTSYLRASDSQRISLLRGLMDSDGTCDSRGQCTFVSTCQPLANDFLQLVSTLGIKATITTKEAKIYGKLMGLVYCIKFLSPFPVFNLNRKSKRQKLTGFRPTVTKRYVVAVSPIEPCPVKCLTVEHPSGTFLVGKTCIPTHNSGGARRVMLKRRIEHPGTRGAIFRRTFSLVKENHIDKYLQEYPFLQEFYHVGDSEIRFPNGSVLAFRYADTQQAVDAHIGKEYMDVIVDQGEAFNEHEHITLASICRWPGVDESACKYIVTFNPGNVGHKYLQRIFFDKKYRMSDGEFKTEVDGNKAIALNPELEWMENPTDYGFIQAYGWDNVEWARSPLRKQMLATNGETYEDYLKFQPEKQASVDRAVADEFYSWNSDKRFEYYTKKTQFGREQNALPTAMRIGWLLGHMDQFAGQYYDIFAPQRHIRPVVPQEWHTRWIGIDWGWDHDSACHWLSQISENLTGVYREFVADQRSPKALAQQIVDMTAVEERPMIKHIYLSHDAFAKKNEQDTTADQMAEVFRRNKMPYPEVGSTDVGGRAALLYDMLGPQDPVTQEYKTPEIVIDPSCGRLIEVIPQVCIDSNKPLNRKDKLRPLKFEGDDAMDSLWYSLTARMKQAKVPREVVLMEQANQIADPTARWFFLQKHRAHQPKPVIAPRVIMPWENARR